MKLDVDLTDCQLEALRARAQSLAVSLDPLASAAVTDLTWRSADDCATAAPRMMSKNAELDERWPEQAPEAGGNRGTCAG